MPNVGTYIPSPSPFGRVPAYGDIACMPNVVAYIQSPYPRGRVPAYGDIAGMPNVVTYIPSPSMVAYSLRRYCLYAKCRHMYHLAISTGLVPAYGDIACMTNVVTCITSPSPLVLYQPTAILPVCQMSSHISTHPSPWSCTSQRRYCLYDNKYRRIYPLTLSPGRIPACGDIACMPNFVAYIPFPYPLVKY